jgi:penicillin amidase
VLAALAAALGDLARAQGPDPHAWRLGRTNHVSFHHPFVAAFDRGDVERGGDAYTLDVFGRSGASFRAVFDFADWDASRAINVPGQSAQPESPHYDDLLPLWARDETFPLLFTRPRVEAATRDRLVLEPAPLTPTPAPRP